MGNTQNRDHRTKKNANDRPYVWDVWHSHAVTTSQELLVLLALYSFKGVRGIFPSQGRLAARCRMSLRTVNKVVNQLRKKGLVETTSRGKALTYRLIELAAEPSRTSAPAAQQMRTPCSGPTQDMLRDPKSAIEVNQLTKASLTDAQEPSHRAQQAISRLPMMQSTQDNRGLSIRSMAVRAGHSEKQALRLEFMVANRLVSSGPAEAARIRAAIANAPLSADPRTVLKAVLSAVGAARLAA